MYKLIADSGASKTDWAVTGPEGVRYFSTSGLNPHLLTDEEIGKILKEEVIPAAKGSGLAEIFFYGSGCAAPEMKEKMLRCFMEYIPVAGIHISTDLEAAGIALFGDTEGLVCILGTGSSAGIYSGGLMIRQLGSLAFPEGDRGSGAAIMYGLLKELQKEDGEDFETAIMDLTDKKPDALLRSIDSEEWDRIQTAALYKKTAPLHSRPLFQKVIAAEIGTFIDQTHDKVSEIGDLSWGFIGSIALLNEHLIRDICNKNSIRVHRITRKPIEQLHEYHST